MTFTARGLYASSSKVPREQRQWRHGWLLIGAVVGLFALGMGALSVLSGVSTTVITERQEFAAAAEVEVDNRTVGNVTVIGGRGDSVTVETRTRSSLTVEARQDARTEDDRLRLGADCGGNLVVAFGNCAVDYLVTVPEKTEVHVVTETGAADITGVAATVKATTSTGPIRLAGVTGGIILESDTGNITAEGSGPAATVRSGIGRVDLEFFEAVEVDAVTSTGDILVGSGFESAQVRSDIGSLWISTDTAFRTLTAATDSGNVEIRVPDSVYRVVSETGSGTETVEVDRSADADSAIEVRSDIGSIVISPD